MTLGTHSVREHILSERQEQDRNQGRPPTLLSGFLLSANDTKWSEFSQFSPKIKRRCWSGAEAAAGVGRVPEHAQRDIPGVNQCMLDHMQKSMQSYDAIPGAILPSTPTLPLHAPFHRHATCLSDACFVKKKAVKVPPGP